MCGWTGHIQGNLPLRVCEAARPSARFSGKFCPQGNIRGKEFLSRDCAQKWVPPKASAPSALTWRGFCSIIQLTIRLTVNCMAQKGRGITLSLQHTLRALADPIRREILNLLKNGRMSAGEISSHFPVTAASISRHLSVLKEADLIRDQREGKYIFYELNASVLEEVLLWIAELKGETDDEKDPHGT